MKRYIIYICVLLLPAVQAAAQDSVRTKRSSSVMQKSAVYDLSRALEQDEDDLAVAAGYEKVAAGFAGKGEYARAEDYYDRANKLYLKNNQTEKTALIYREIAKMQELQKKNEAAILNYRNAGRLAPDSVQKELNANDARRLQDADPLRQSTLLTKNIELLNTASFEEDEQVSAYSQMAQRSMADRYASENKLDEAIQINQQILEEAEQKKDTRVQMEQLHTLSSNYAEKQDRSQAITSLQQAYDLAIQEGHTLDARNTVELLVDQYRQERNNTKIIETYSDFVGKLAPLILADSTLIDEKTLQVHEDRIAQLEKERELKDELIRRKNLTNHILTGSILLAALSLLVIARLLRQAVKKGKKISLQSLRREMNPHFIFNSLNSVNQYIAQNNEREANKYLSSYSRLMRNMMENSSRDFTSLSTELEQLKEYLELEQMRFRETFSYEIQVDERIDPDAVLIPNMLIQPQLENAIWHGLRYRDSKGLLILDIRTDNDGLTVCIDDNGIGLEKSRELKTRHQKQHQSRGLSNTRERIQLLNSLYNCKIRMEITEKTEAPGVTVTFRFPVKYKKK